MTPQPQPWMVEAAKEILAYCAGIRCDGAYPDPDVIAILARLKKEMPHKYHEKLQVEGRMATLRLSVTITPDEAKRFLKEMLTYSMPETRQALTEGAAEGDVVEAEIVSGHPDQP